MSVGSHGSAREGSHTKEEKNILRWISGNTRNIGFTWDGLVMFRGERLMH